MIAASAGSILKYLPADIGQFAGATPQPLEARLAAQLRPRTMPAGTVITLAGDESPPLVALIAGSVTLTSGGGAADCGPIDIITGPAWVATGSIPTLLPSVGDPVLATGVVRAAATVIAREPAIVATIGSAQLARLLSSDPELHITLVHSALTMLPRLMLALSDSLLPGGERRCAATLLRLAAGGTHVPVAQAELAQLAGMSRDTAARALREFEDRGMLRLRYRNIELLDRDRLMRVREG